MSLTSFPLMALLWCRNLLKCILQQPSNYTRTLQSLDQNRIGWIWNVFLSKVKYALCTHPERTQPDRLILGGNNDLWLVGWNQHQILWDSRVEPSSDLPIIGEMVTIIRRERKPRGREMQNMSPENEEKRMPDADMDSQSADSTNECVESGCRKVKYKYFKPSAEGPSMTLRKPEWSWRDCDTVTYLLYQWKILLTANHSGQFKTGSKATNHES